MLVNEPRADLKYLIVRHRDVIELYGIKVGGNYSEIKLSSLPGGKSHNDAMYKIAQRVAHRYGLNIEEGDSVYRLTLLCNLDDFNSSLVLMKIALDDMAKANNICKEREIITIRDANEVADEILDKCLVGRRAVERYTSNDDLEISSLAALD